MNEHDVNRRYCRKQIYHLAINFWLLFYKYLSLVSVDFINTFFLDSLTHTNNKKLHNNSLKKVASLSDRLNFCVFARNRNVSERTTKNICMTVQFSFKADRLLNIRETVHVILIRKKTSFFEKYLSCISLALHAIKESEKISLKFVYCTIHKISLWFLKNNLSVCVHHFSNISLNDMVASLSYNGYNQCNSDICINIITHSLLI